MTDIQILEEHDGQPFLAHKFNVLILCNTELGGISPDSSKIWWKYNTTLRSLAAGEISAGECIAKMFDEECQIEYLKYYGIIQEVVKGEYKLNFEFEK